MARVFGNLSAQINIDKPQSISLNCSSETPSTRREGIVYMGRTIGREGGGGGGSSN